VSQVEALPTKGNYVAAVNCAIADAHMIYDFWCATELTCEYALIKLRVLALFLKLPTVALQELWAWLISKFALQCAALSM
jgi:hypothetical protein